MTQNMKVEKLGQKKKENIEDFDNVTLGSF